MNTELKFRRTIEERELIERGDTVVIAVSGGVDSMTLLDLFAKAGESLKLKLAAAHVNHGLRGAESDAEEELVKDAAARLRIPFHATQWNFDERGNLQDEARRFRTNFFLETALKIGARAVATAHHQDDQVETVLMHMIRGAGLKGLSGIAWRSDLRHGVSLIRPLLDIGRNEIETYAAAHNIAYSTDSSNLSCDYARNDVRMRLVPLMENLNPGIRCGIAAMADRLRDDDETLHEIAKSFCDGNLKREGDSLMISREEFLKLSKGVRRRVLIQAFETLCGSRTNLSADHIEHMETLSEIADPRSSYPLPGDIRYERNYDRLMLYPC